MGVWIEISNSPLLISMAYVAPHMGVWIEITTLHHCNNFSLNVAPYMGVWIEIKRI